MRAAHNHRARRVHGLGQGRNVHYKEARFTNDQGEEEVSYSYVNRAPARLLLRRRGDSEFMARMMFGDARCALGIGRAIDRIFGGGFLGENGIGIRRLRPRPGKEAGIFVRPAIWRVCHSDLKMLPQTVGEETNPCLSSLVITHERLGSNRTFVAIAGILGWKVPYLPEPTVSQGL